MSQKYYSTDTHYLKKKPVNLFHNPQLRTIRTSKLIYDRHTKDKKTLTEIAHELGYSFTHVSRLYNWYVNYMKEVTI